MKINVEWRQPRHYIEWVTDRITFFVFLTTINCRFFSSNFGMNAFAKLLDFYLEITNSHDNNFYLDQGHVRKKLGLAQ